MQNSQRSWKVAGVVQAVKGQSKEAYLIWSHMIQILELRVVTAAQSQSPSLTGERGLDENTGPPCTVRLSFYNLLTPSPHNIVALKKHDEEF